MIKRWFVGTSALLALTACTTGPMPLSPKIKSEMPAPGTLRPGEIAYVDDGGCVPGQVKRVMGGGDRVYGTNIERAGIARQVTCVPRPQVPVSPSRTAAIRA